MLGAMMPVQLTITSILDHAERFHGGAEIVSVDQEKRRHCYTYSDMARRTRQAAAALARLGVKKGDRVATLAWNGHRHLELYYAASCMGAVCHTINPRLFPAQIAQIANHAEDVVLCFDLTFSDLVKGIAPSLTTVRHLVALCDVDQIPTMEDHAAQAYESLLNNESGDFIWPELDEKTPCSLCYTSGTTGMPKGVLYDHRSQVLHAMAVNGADWIAIRAQDAIMPVVPMFHACAWGIPYAALMSGAKLVLPGRHLDGASLHQLINQEQVTIAAAVPTVWMDMLECVAKVGGSLDSLYKVMVGGSAAPLSQIKTFEEVYDVRVLHGWGMTEVSPVGSQNALKRHMLDWPAEKRYGMQSLHGRPLYGVDMRVVDAQGTPLPHDGVHVGDLQIRGPWVVGQYFKNESPESFTADGWFNTGDVAVIDEDGFMRLTDRTKDVIKSGGEWISSIDVENAAISHPAVREAACIAVKHPRWGERPLLVVVLKEGEPATKADILAAMEGKIAKWWMPNEVVIAESLPHSATGKLLKIKLREAYRDFVLPDD